MIKNLIFDFGKVLVDYDFEGFFQKYIPDDERRKVFVPILYNEELQCILDRELRPFDEVMDRITVYVSGNATIKDVCEKNREAIAGVVLADDIVYDTTDGFVKDWNLNGEDVTIGVKKN